VDPTQLKPDTQRLIQSKIKERQRTRKLIAEHRWEKIATPKQLPPDHARHHRSYDSDIIDMDVKTLEVKGRAIKTLSCSQLNENCHGISKTWTHWILIAGRGYGKTQSGANWVTDMAMLDEGCEIAIVAPTFQGVRERCFEGRSGILKVLRDNYPGQFEERRGYNKNNMKITLRNGSVIQGYSVEQSEAIRGSNLTYAWLEELGSFGDEQYKVYTEVLLPALRIKRKDGGEPRMIITTTPKPNKLIRHLIKQCKIRPEKYHLTRAFTTEANWLSNDAVVAMIAAMSPEEVRQELLAELITDSPLAYFRLSDFEKYRYEFDDLPKLTETVVAVDPAMTSGIRSDETGIVVAAMGIVDGAKHTFVLEDASLKGTPDQVATAIQGAFYRHEADLVIVEQNAGGDWVPTMLSYKDSFIPVRTVQARKGKEIRAAPFGRLNEVGRIHMVGSMDTLEMQLSHMMPDQDRRKVADDRADAFVWAMNHLAGKPEADWLRTYGFQDCAGPECDQRVNYLKDKICKSCGHPVVRDKYDSRNEEKAATRWWNAYLKKCDNGHKYPQRLKNCPECKTDPGTYLAAVAAMSMTGAGRGGYSGIWHTSRRQ
jgi:phage terminase large subunit-like protein